MLALLLGFLLTYIVLIAFSFVQLFYQWKQDDHDFGSTDVGMQLRAAFSTVESPEQVRAIAAALDRIETGQVQRAHSPATVVLQVLDRNDGRVLFSSPAIASAILHGDPHHKTSNIINGNAYDVYVSDISRWRLLWARMQTPRTFVFILEALTADLLPNMALALPCFLLPVWLVVTFGLRPLKRFSKEIEARGPGDLSPTGADSKHGELKPLGAALNELLARLRRKRESEEAFVANAAHELRTPLAVIAAQAHVLANAGSGPERWDAQERMEAALDRASHLIHQLLLLARMEMEQQERGAVDLAQLVRQELAQFFPAANRRRMEISLDAPDRLMLTVETHSLRSILQNLVDNAIRYGREEGRIWVDLRHKGSILTLSVADDGPGIDLPARERMFDRFQRGAGTGVPGTGLGLTIVKQGAVRMGGDVYITDGPDGRGCRFTVCIRTPARLEASPKARISVPT